MCNSRIENSTTKMLPAIYAASCNRAVMVQPTFEELRAEFIIHNKTIDSRNRTRAVVHPMSDKAHFYRVFLNQTSNHIGVVLLGLRFGDRFMSLPLNNNSLESSLGHSLCICSTARTRPRTSYFTLLYRAVNGL